MKTSLKSAADAENRSFLARAYPTMKKNNPHTPIMLREAAGTQPRVYARYGQSIVPKWTLEAIDVI